MVRDNLELLPLWCRKLLVDQLNKEALGSPIDSSFIRQISLLAISMSGPKGSMFRDPTSAIWLRYQRTRYLSTPFFGQQIRTSDPLSSGIDTSRLLQDTSYTSTLYISSFYTKHRSHYRLFNYTFFQSTNSYIRALLCEIHLHHLSASKLDHIHLHQVLILLII